MQLMTWMLARLGSRFCLLFEPSRRRVMHSGLGRFLDRPTDLMVGLVEPDGTERVLPFTSRGVCLANAEQFERFNSITFRGYSEHYRLRFEFNIHSVFYPQDEPLCVMPAFYVEMRVNPSDRVRGIRPKGPRPDKVKLFIRLDRPNTRISAAANPDGSGGRIDLAYQQTLTPRTDFDSGESVPAPAPAPGSDAPATGSDVTASAAGEARTVQVCERIVSINLQCAPEPDGKGLTLELPVSEVGSGVKWRLVWGAHCAEPVLDVDADADAGDGNAEAARCAGRFRYVQRLPDIDAVMAEAVRLRDDRLNHSRRLEKLFDQAPLTMAQRHLINQSWQMFLANTFWCDLDGPGPADGAREWFSAWDGGTFRQSPIDAQYNVALIYLALWPRLLRLQLAQSAALSRPHEPSGGRVLARQVGSGVRVGRHDHAAGDVPVEQNADFLLLLQAYAHWTGDLGAAAGQCDLIQRLAAYLAWCDRDADAFPCQGTTPVPAEHDGHRPPARTRLKPTDLAVKRLAGLQAAADLLYRLDQHDAAARLERIVEADAPRIEQQAWLNDHYAVCMDRTDAGIADGQPGEPAPFQRVPGWDGYSINIANGLLLPAMIGQPLVLDPEHLTVDMYTAMRETMSPYGCGPDSTDVEHVYISQNLWRDHLGEYLGLDWTPFLTQRYWDMQVMSNTDQQSLGYADTYVHAPRTFGPRGVASIGYMLGQPRLVIDRLAPGGPRISVAPSHTYPQRWPLFPLADWKAGKIPICVVDDKGHVTIEGATDPVIIHGESVGELIG